MSSWLYDVARHLLADWADRWALRLIRFAGEMRRP